LKPRTTAAGNRCDACSDVDDANQSAPESTCGYMERNRVSLRPSREEDDEGKQISYRSTSRTELRQRRRRRRRPERLEEGREQFQSCDLLLEVAASQRRREPVSDLKGPNGASSERGRRRARPTTKEQGRYLRCSLLLRLDVRRSFFEVQREMVARRGQHGRVLGDCATDQLMERHSGGRCTLGWPFGEYSTPEAWRRPCRRRSASSLP
jgi:hypothetical protein